MNRITRSVVTSPYSLPLFLTSTSTSTTTCGRRISLPVRTALLTLSAPKHRIITTCASLPASMESRDPPPPHPEDFVHIDESNDALSDSIVNVADEMRREAEEENAQNVTVLPENYSTGHRGVVPNIPAELSRNVVYLTCESAAGYCEVYLVGTAHVSLESCREVELLIDFLKPEVVFLELCASRVAMLTPQSLKIPTAAEMMEMYKKNHNLFAILYSWFLAKAAKELEVFPGSEFRVAFEEAKKYGAKVVLGDRPVQVTLRRTWAKMPLWHKTKLLFSLLFQSFFLPSAEELNKMLEEMDDVDMLTLVIQEMSKKFPTLMETLVDERDKYMSSNILRYASGHTSLVAVVGKGHLPGIKNHWKKPVKMEELLELPPEKPAVSVTKVLTCIGAGVAGVAIISGLYLAYKK